MKKSDLSQYFSKLGKRGGAAHTARKRAASRENLKRAWAAKRKQPVCQAA